MDCSYTYGAPAIIHEVVGSNQPVLPPSQRKCPRCNGGKVKTGMELNLEMDEVMRAYLKEKYPNFTFKPKYRQEAGN
jgi:hypothetical protein